MLGGQPTWGILGTLPPREAVAYLDQGRSGRVILQVSVLFHAVHRVKKNARSRPCAPLQATFAQTTFAPLSDFAWMC